MLARMAPPISIVKEHGVLVVDFQVDAITTDQVLDAMKETVAARIPETRQAILFDCAHLSGRVTSQFFAALVAIRQQATAQKVLVCLCNLDGPLREAYSITRLERIIPVYEDRAAALTAVGDLSRPERLRRAADRIREEQERRANMTGLDHVGEFFGRLWLRGAEKLGPYARNAAVLVGCLLAAALLAGAANNFFDGPGRLPAPREAGVD